MEQFQALSDKKQALEGAEGKSTKAQMQLYRQLNDYEDKHRELENDNAQLKSTIYLFFFLGALRRSSISLGRSD